MRVIGLSLLLALAVSAQMGHSNLAGTWKMDVARSESAHQDVPIDSSLLTIQVTDGGVQIETTRDEGGKPGAFHEVMNFKPGGVETTSTGDGGVSVTCKAHWNGAKLVAETMRNVQEATVTTTYIYSLSANGRELTVDKTLTVQHGYMGRSAPTTGRGKDVFVRLAAK